MKRNTTVNGGNVAAIASGGSMLFLCANDVAIRRAATAGTLRVAGHLNRFGDVMFSIEDDRGTIEVCFTQMEADARVDAVLAR